MKLTSRTRSAGLTPRRSARAARPVAHRTGSASTTAAGGWRRRVGELAAHLGDLGDRQEGGHRDQDESGTSAGRARRSSPAVRRAVRRRGRPVRSRAPGARTGAPDRGGRQASSRVLRRRAPRTRRAGALVLESENLGACPGWCRSRGRSARPTASRAREASRPAAPPAPTASAGVQRETAAAPAPAASRGGRAMPARAHGTSTATNAGAIVWAKKYSTVSMSWVAGRPGRRSGADQVGGRERFEPGRGDAHLGEQAVGHVVREPRFEPVEQPGERRDHQQGARASCGKAAALHRRERPRAEHGDADERGDPRDAEHDGHGELAAPRPDHAEQRGDGRAPAQARHRRSSRAATTPAAVPSAPASASLAAATAPCPRGTAS